MSSSARCPPHRRRSHSVSSPLSGTRHLSSDKWRVASKRSRPSHFHKAADQPPEKWDVDMWRRGKRVRRDGSSPRGTTEGPLIFARNTMFRADQRSNPSCPASGLPSSSAAFELFPNRSKKDRRNSDQSPRLFCPSPLMPVDSEPQACDSISRLRSDAFGELHRSVAENGEGLVSRMRDWEDSRSAVSKQPRLLGEAASLTQGRQRRSPSHDPAWVSGVPFVEDDDDDIQIVSGSTIPTTSMNLDAPWSSPRKKRALSLDGMDVDEPEVDTASHATSERCSSPVDTAFSVPSEFASDDEEVNGSLGISSFTPALSHTFTSSANSSLVSLPLLPSSGTFDTPLTPHVPVTANRGSHGSRAPYVPSTASRSEKAIAALTLAMANGAGGLNDYEPVRIVEDGTRAIDESLIGEMWH